jgi:hypothetical protein
VAELLEKEKAAGMGRPDYYLGFQAKADAVKNGLLQFLLRAEGSWPDRRWLRRGGEGNTLLNYAGVKPDLLPYVVDASPHKQGMYLPGSRIPVVAESRLQAERPDFVIVFPWNLKERNL